MADKEKFDKNKYDQKFHKDNYTSFSFRFRNNADKEIINKINSFENKADYIRKLIQDDINKSK